MKASKKKVENDKMAQMDDAATYSTFTVTNQRIDQALGDRSTVNVFELRRRLRLSFLFELFLWRVLVVLCLLHVYCT